MSYMELSPAMIAQFDKYLKEYMYARILLLSIFVILAVVNQFSDAPFYTPLIKGLRKKYQRLCIIAINIVLLLVFGWFARGVVTSTHEICRDLKESSYTCAHVKYVWTGSKDIAAIGVYFDGKEEGESMEIGNIFAKDEDFPYTFPGEHRDATIWYSEHSRLVLQLTEDVP